MTKNGYDERTDALTNLASAVGLLAAAADRFVTLIETEAIQKTKKRA